MAVEFRPFVSGDLQFVQAQPAQLIEQQFMKAAPYAAELAGGVAQTLWVDGKVTACAGIVRLAEPDRTVCWALLSMQARQHMVAISLKIIRVLNALPERRVQMGVRQEYADGHRWATMLGFVADHVEDDELIYVRVR